MDAVDAYAMLDGCLRRWGALPDVELGKAHRIFRPRRVPARTLLQRAGEPAEQVSFVVRGLTRMFYLADGGAERTTGFRAEGELVCSYAAALRDAPSQQFIEALEACELLTAQRSAFAELCAGDPSWAAVLAAMTERLFLDEQGRHRDLLTGDATTRYLTFVTERPELVARLTQRQIASYVGVSPEALSRIRTALAKA